MNLWRRALAWRRRPVVDGYAANVRALLNQAAEGRTGADPSTAPTVAAAATLYGSALASATVTNGPPALGPAILGHIGRGYVLAGEAALLIEVVSGDLALHPVTIRQHYADGRYEITRDLGEGDVQDEIVPAAELAIVVFEQSSDPMRGRPPWARSLAAAAEAEIAANLAAEASGPVGLSHSRPGDSSGEVGDAVEDAVTKRLNDADGAIVAVPALTDSGYWSAATRDVATPPNATQGAIARFGPMYPVASPQLLQELGGAVAAACGVPPVLVAGGGSSQTATRESWRLWIAANVSGVAAIAEAALRDALDSPTLEIGLGGLASADTAARSRAAGSIASATSQLVAAGFEREEALRLARELAGFDA